MNLRSIKILLVEDNPEDLCSLQESLAASDTAKFELVHVDRLNKALKRLSEERFDVILLDLSLPDGQGLDTFYKVYNYAPKLPILVLNGLGDDALSVEAVREGAQDYLVKEEMDGKLLARAIRYAIERKQTEEELKESNRRLEETLAELSATQQQVIQQERLRALGRMASGIVHEFNNVLMPILGYSDILLMVPQALDDKEQTKNYLKMINSSAKEAQKIVSNLREFYRYRNKDETFLPVNLNQLVEQAIELTKPKWKDQALAKGITIDIETNLQEGIPHINGNEAELRDLLNNLILNAVDAIHGKGTITIRSRYDDEYVVLEVNDTGVGMTEEVRKRCFEPFFSTKTGLGIGLGLAVVHGIIQRHKGKINLKSEVDKGTNFIIHLPRHAKKNDEKTSQKAEINPRPLNVLFVDDEEMVRDTITAYLSADGHTVETATNGREGLEKFRAGSFDLVITDMAMPDINGVQMAKFIKRMAPNTKIIMLTGFGEMIKVSEEMPEGVDYLLNKPLTLAEFHEALAKIS